LSCPRPLLLQVVREPWVVLHCEIAGGGGRGGMWQGEQNTTRTEARCITQFARSVARVRATPGGGMFGLCAARTLALSAQLDTAPHHVEHWPPVPGGVDQESA
jgi:hypothetical protein